MKLLYIYDKKDWAIHNVGKLWFLGLPGIQTTFLPIDELPSVRFSGFDVIWFGYFGMFFRQRPASLPDQKRPSILDRIPPLRNLLNIKKSVIAIHDPSELFPLAKNWQKSAYGRTAQWIMQNAAGVVVLSQEMEALLRSRGIHVYTISTMSSLPPIEESEIRTDKCSAYSAFNRHPRKNLPLLEKLQAFCTDTLGIRFDCKSGLKILTEKEYIQELDAHEIYVCTSVQEGGPLPAMDAMMRGAIVATTPVGQMPELISNGENGFICRDEEEFKRTLRYLSECDCERLHDLRLASRRAILGKRQRPEIQKRVQNFLAQL
jgi:Glycosyl transferases group 1